MSRKLAKWGLDSVGTRVIPYHPDLVIIGFGMNDGSSDVLPEQFGKHIKEMMDAISVVNDKVEYILIAPMLPNPDAIQAGIQEKYKTELLKLQKQGVAIADMTGVHIELLKHKRYQDMTGNNVNHPNDYLARWYAQTIISLF